MGYLSRANPVQRLEGALDQVTALVNDAIQINQ
jgi:hypothetical protein